jgi:hypothetical protein
LGRRRLVALERLAVELHTDPSDELEAALIVRWRGRAAVIPAAPPEPAAGPATSERPPRERASSSRPWPALLLILIVIGLGVGVALLASALGGDDNRTSPATTAERTTASSTARRPPPRPVPPRAGLQPLPGVRGASGSARIVGRQLRLRLRGLPRTAGGYTAWLYNSIADAAPVARFAGGNGSLKAELSRKPSGYRFIDISREPPDGNPNHSGISVLRVPVASLIR